MVKVREDALFYKHFTLITGVFTCVLNAQGCPPGICGSSWINEDIYLLNEVGISVYFIILLYNGICICTSFTFSLEVTLMNDQVI